MGQLRISTNIAVEEDDVPAGYSEFEFDLPRALKAELVRLLAEMETEQLRPQTTEEIADAQGVYQLF